MSKDDIIEFGWLFFVILGCVQPVIWFFGSLAVYCSLERPLWEVALVVGVPLFVFTKFGLWVVGRRPSGSGSGELPEAGDVAEERTEESLVAEIREWEEQLVQLEEKRREAPGEEPAQELEVERGYIKGQLEKLQLMKKIREFRRLGKEAEEAGHKDKAEEHSEQLEQLEASLEKLRAEEIRQVEEQLSKLEQELEGARGQGSKKELKRIEGKRKDILRQLEWLQLTREIEKSRVLGQEAKAAGREGQAGKHFEQAEQLETSRESLERGPDYTRLEKIILYMIIGIIVATCIGIPLGLAGMTWAWWQGWADGSSQWMRSPAQLLGATWGFLALACLGVQVISWVTSPEEPETSEESPREERGEPAGRDPEESQRGDTLAASDKSPPPPPDAPA